MDFIIINKHWSSINQIFKLILKKIAIVLVPELMLAIAVLTSMTVKTAQITLIPPILLWSKKNVNWPVNIVHRMMEIHVEMRAIIVIRQLQTHLEIVSNNRLDYQSSFIFPYRSIQ